MIRRSPEIREEFAHKERGDPLATHQRIPIRNSPPLRASLSHLFHHIREHRCACPAGEA